MFRSSASSLHSFVAFVVLVPAVTLHAAFELTGELPADFPDGMVTVERESLEERSFTPVARVPLANGHFHLQVEAQAGLFVLRIGDAQTSFVAADGQALRVSADSGKLLIEGGRDHERYAEYETFRNESLTRHVLSVRAALRTARTSGNEAEIERLTEAEVTGYITHRRELNDFTLERLRGSPALYAASLRWDDNHRINELADVVRDFARQHADLEISRLLEARIARFEATAIGALAPELSGPAPDGATISLSDLRGRHVLVDFWASWCAPCRTENRHYRELYRRYRDAGFEILAVSVDQDGAAWRSAIAADQAVWLHLSDLSGWKTPLAARYNVTALPASFLIDPEGRIIAKDARGGQLDALLLNLFSAVGHRVHGRKH